VTLESTDSDSLGRAYDRIMALLPEDKVVKQGAKTAD
jgi:hypothetical protein